MANEFSLSKLAAALKAVNDVGGKLMQDCMDRADADDGKGAVAIDLEPLRDALTNAFYTIGPRAGAEDSDDPNDKPEKRLKQEQTAADRRTVRGAVDSRTVGAGSAFAGVGDYTPGRASDYSIDQIFNGSEGATDLEHSVDSVFHGRETLGEG